MALEVGDITHQHLPGLTRRFPVRLMGKMTQLVPGRRYRVRVAMHDSNPAFEAVYLCKGQFTGPLYSYAEAIEPFGQIEHTLYAHVLTEI